MKLCNSRGMLDTLACFTSKKRLGFFIISCSWFENVHAYAVITSSQSRIAKVAAVICSSTDFLLHSGGNDTRRVDFHSNGSTLFSESLLPITGYLILLQSFATVYKCFLKHPDFHHLNIPCVSAELLEDPHHIP